MQIVFLFYEGMAALDAIGPHEILCRFPGAKIQRAARKPGLIQTDSSGLKLCAEHALTEISQADILVLPGAGSAATFRKCPETLSWIRSIHGTTQWTTSICTGSLILGAAGLLSGLKATTHWAVLDRLRFWDAEPTSERIVEAGKIITAAGVSAGIDMALFLAARMYGPQIAQMLQLGIEYDPEPPFDAGSPQKVCPEIRDALLSRMGVFFEKHGD